MAITSKQLTLFCLVWSSSSSFIGVSFSLSRTSVGGAPSEVSSLPDVGRTPGCCCCHCCTLGSNAFMFNMLKSLDIRAALKLLVKAGDCLLVVSELVLLVAGRDVRRDVITVDRRPSTSDRLSDSFSLSFRLEELINLFLPLGDKDSLSSDVMSGNIAIREDFVLIVSAL